MGRTKAIKHLPHPKPAKHSPESQFALVVIACSAGGLAAVARVLSELSPEFPVPVALVIHLAPSTVSPLCEILQRSTRLTVEWARQGTRLHPGHVYVAPPDQHLLVNANFSCRLSLTTKVSWVRPAGDVLFASAAAAFGRRVVGVVLSGAGQDGASGAVAIHGAGGTVVAQAPASSEVSGMPMAAIDSGGTDLVVPLDSVASTLIGLVTRR